jgi:hypothetical protein
VFGVCSVIAMLAIGEGASYEAQEQIKSLGSQNIILHSVKPPDEQKVSNQSSQSRVLQYGVTYADVQRITATIPGVTVMLPERIIRDYVWNISHRVDCEIAGTVPWYPAMRNQPVARGRFFTENDMDGKTSVCVLGAEMVPLLFPLESPLGKHVRVETMLYGLLLPSGNDAAMALARHVGESLAEPAEAKPVERFVALMNRTAQQMGLADTHFVNPHGFDDPDHYTSPYDLASMTWYAFHEPKFNEIVRTQFSYEAGVDFIARALAQPRGASLAAQLEMPEARAAE